MAGVRVQVALTDEDVLVIARDLRSKVAFATPTDEEFQVFDAVLDQGYVSRYEMEAFKNFMERCARDLDRDIRIWNTHAASAVRSGDKQKEDNARSIVNFRLDTKRLVGKVHKEAREALKLSDEALPLFEKYFRKPTEVRL